MVPWWWFKTVKFVVRWLLIIKLLTMYDLFCSIIAEQINIHYDNNSEYLALFLFIIISYPLSHPTPPYSFYFTLPFFDPSNSYCWFHRNADFNSCYRPPQYQSTHFTLKLNWYFFNEFLCVKMFFFHILYYKPPQESTHSFSKVL